MRQGRAFLCVRLSDRTRGAPGVLLAPLPARKPERVSRMQNQARQHFANIPTNVLKKIAENDETYLAMYALSVHWNARENERHEPQEHER